MKYTLVVSYKASYVKPWSRHAMSQISIFSSCLTHKLLTIKVGSVRDWYIPPFNVDMVYGMTFPTLTQN